MNIHSSFASTPYDDHGRVLSTLRDLGVRHVRDGLFTPSGASSVRLRQRAFRASLAAHGIRTLTIMGEPGEDPARYVAEVRDEAAQTLSGIEGPNEWDLSGRAGWAAEVRGYQRALHTAARADPRLAGTPVLGPSLGRDANASVLGNVGAWTDRANIHAYPAGRAPGTFDDGVTALASTVSGGQAPIITETGFHNAMWQYGGQPPTSEAAAAVYTTRLFLENFRRGIPRTFAYELINAHHDPLQVIGNYHFGLLRNDWSPKPVYAALRNLIRLVDPQDADVPAGSLDYSLHGDLRGVSQVLLRRADGSFALAVWQTAPVWDPYARRSLYPSPRAITLKVSAPAAVATAVPAAGATAARVAASATSVNLSVPGGDPLLVVIDPIGTPPQPGPGPGVTYAAPHLHVVPVAPGAKTARPSRRTLTSLRRKAGRRPATTSSGAKAKPKRAKSKRPKPKRAKGKRARR